MRLCWCFINLDSLNDFQVRFFCISRSFYNTFNTSHSRRTEMIAIGGSHKMNSDFF